MKQPQRVALAALAFGILATVGYLWWQSRAPLPASQLIRFLPPEPGHILFADVSVLRRAGLLDRLAGPGVVEEADYRQFVNDTGFDYRRDLTALVIRLAGDRSDILAQGEFDWPRLERFVAKQGGQCQDGYCTARASDGRRTVSFWQPRRGMIALSTAPDPMAARSLSYRDSLPVEPGTQPVWASVSPLLLRTGNVPTGTRLFASALAGAERILFTAGPQGDQLQLTAEVRCSSPEEAARLKGQLEELTKLVTSMIKREGQQPNPADVSGLLTSGSFAQEGTTVRGQWPLRPQFLQTTLGAQ